MPEIFRIGALFAAVCLLSSCGQTTTPHDPPVSAFASESPIRLPGRIVRTDGNGDLRVTVAGPGRCLRTSGQQAQIALAATNDVRRKRGLSLLTTNAVLQSAAENHACEMAGRGLMTHGGSRTSGPSARVKALGYKPRVTAENIAAGQLSLTRVMGEWSQSPGHVANIVIPQLKHYGVGQALSADGKSSFWAAVYADGK